MSVRSGFVLVPLLFTLIVMPAVSIAGPAATDTSYFDGFTDLTGLDPFRSLDVDLDAMGGVRIKGNGPSSPATWTTQADFDFQKAVTFKPDLLVGNPLITLPTLDSVATPDSLTLRSSPLALRRQAVSPVLLPSDPVSGDGYGVGGMCVRRVNLPDAVYYMWYTGVPENEFTARIYLAKSNDGRAWTRYEKIDPVTLEEIPVLDVGEPGSFDSRQLGKPTVFYDAAAAPPNPKFKMWYTAEGDHGGSIGYATSDDGINWTRWIRPIAVLEATGDVGQYVSLALGRDGLPIVSYYDVTNGDLKFARCGNAACTEGNTILTLDEAGDVGRYTSLAIGADGFPVISYYDVTNGDLKVLHCATSACTVGNVISAVDGTGGTDVGQYTSLAIGSNGFPVISYYDVTNGDLKAVACNDAACAGGDEVPVTLDGGLADVGQYTSVAIVMTDPLSPATSSFPFISYYDVTNGALKAVACNDTACAGGDDLPATLDGEDAGLDVGRYTSVAVGDNGFPIIAYYDVTNGDLKVVACNDFACAPAGAVPDDIPVILDGATADVGQYASLAIGAGGLPVISYYDATSGDLKVVECTDATCGLGGEVPAIVDGATEDVGQYTSIAIGADGKPVIAYYDVTNGNLKASPSERNAVEVLGPGLIGSIDSYSVAHPSVQFDNGIYRMWYTANDSNNRRIAYAASTDGVTWARGGKVIDLGNTANDSLGAWAPSVTRDASGYYMVYTGWKQVAGGNTIQSKLITATSPDGTTWTTGNIAQNPGNRDSFDGTNMSQGSILYDPADPDVNARYKMWYVGNTLDDFGNSHDRIGLLLKKETGAWSKFPGLAGLGSVLSLGAQSPAFDSMLAADLRPIADPLDSATLYGFYTGTNAADFKPRIGVKESIDGGLTWDDLVTLTPGTALIGAGGIGAIDEGGVATPSPLYLNSEWAVYHTSLNAAGVTSIALHTVSYDFSTIADGASVISGAADPCAVFPDGATAITLFHAGLDTGLGLWTLRTASFDPADPATMAAGTSPAPLNILPGTAPEEAYDSGGMRRPVAVADGATWRLWYTAIGSDGVERVAYAESTDSGATWTKMGLAIDRSTTAHDFAEKGIRPAGAMKDIAGTCWLTVTGVDRFGWQRVGLLSGIGPGFVDGGSATYQYPDDATLASPGYLPRDWRQIAWNPAAPPEGAGQEIWVSYYPTFSGLWSNFFRIGNGEKLPFMLTVKGMRWQVRLTGKADDVAPTPQLDDLTVDNADIGFPTSGLAVTIPVGPPVGKYLLTWGDLTVNWEQNGGTLSVAIQDQDGTPLVADQPISNSPWTFSLSGAGMPVTSGRLIMVFTLGPDALTTPPRSPLLKNIGVTYTSTNVPSSITITADPAVVYTGGQTAVSGVLESRTVNPDGSETVIKLMGQTVNLKMRTVSQTSWSDLGTALTSSDPGLEGTFSFPANPYALTEATYFRAEWPGNVDIGGVIYPPAVGSLLVEVGPPPVTLALVTTPASTSTTPLMTGKTVVLSGSLTSELGSLAGQTITLKRKTNDNTDFVDFVPALTVTVAANGTFTTAGKRIIKVIENTEFQAVWAGGDVLGTGIIFAETFGNVTAWVKPRLTLVVGGWLGRSGAYFRYPLGSTVAASGKVVPTHYRTGEGTVPGKVTVTVAKYRAASRTWVPIKTVTRSLTLRSTYLWSWKPLSAGRYRLRTTFAGDIDHQPGLSVLRYVEIY